MWAWRGRKIKRWVVMRLGLRRLMMMTYHDDHDVTGIQFTHDGRDLWEEWEQRPNGILLKWWVGKECVPECISAGVHSILTGRGAFTGCLHIYGFDTRSDWD